MDPESLRRLGWKSAHLSSEIPAKDFAQLIRQLHREDIGHLWKEFHYREERTILEEIHRFEESRRPTLILGYFGVRPDGSTVLFGAGAIAEKISHRFEHEGFPVISRCFILPEFRNHRLYAPAVIARVKVCHEYWGSRLKGIHLGSSNSRVHHSIRSHEFAAPFVYLGNEKLCAGGLHLTQDYLLITLRFRQFLIEESESIAGSSSSGPELLLQVQRLLDNQFRSNDYCKLLGILERIRRERPDDPLSHSPALRELLDFFAAVPVIAEANERPVEPEVMIQKRAA